MVIIVSLFFYLSGSPIVCKVLDVVLRDLRAHPLQQLRTSASSIVLTTLNLVAKNDGPNQTENELELGIDNVLQNKSKIRLFPFLFINTLPEVRYRRA